MIILTGVSGFVGSCLLTELNNNGYDREVLVVDDFYKLYKDKNTDNKNVREWMHRDIFLDWFEKTSQKIDFVLHIGARTDTTSQNKAAFDDLNVEYSKRIWNVCVRNQIPLIYASSAATYGDGSLGFSDDHKLVKKLKPLNMYAESKLAFDLWALAQKKTPPFWVGARFFNVYGPNEYHKDRMASVVYHTAKRIKSTGSMQLFRSHKDGIADGYQSRDFIYVKDILKIILFLMKNKDTAESGIYNMGTGQAEAFLDLAKFTFKAMGAKENISFIDTPEDIRENYQYFTQADISKLRKAGYKDKFWTLKDGVTDYVQNYLLKSAYY